MKGLQFFTDLLIPLACVRTYARLRRNGIISIRFSGGKNTQRPLKKVMARKSSLFQSSERFVALEEVLKWLEEVLNWLEEVLNLPPHVFLLLNFLNSNNFLQANLWLSLVLV